jgi:hypothetical protein
MVIIKRAVFRILISDVGGVVYTNLFNLYYNIALRISGHENMVVFL